MPVFFIYRKIGNSQYMAPVSERKTVKTPVRPGSCLEGEGEGAGGDRVTGGLPEIRYF